MHDWLTTPPHWRSFQRLRLSVFAAPGPLFMVQSPDWTQKNALSRSFCATVMGRDSVLSHPGRRPAARLWGGPTRRSEGHSGAGRASVGVTFREAAATLAQIADGESSVLHKQRSPASPRGHRELLPWPRRFLVSICSGMTFALLVSAIRANVVSDDNSWQTPPIFSSTNPFSNVAASARVAAEPSGATSGPAAP